jgi:predicted N-acyltransferase
LRFTIAEGLDEVDPAAWDACAGFANPFVGHAFLHALEASGSASTRTGWQPVHGLVLDDAGTPLAAAPAYAKSHSWGEYVFDHGWADAYERAGGRYYPKLQVAVPFTPVPGPRLLARPDAPAAARALLADGLVELARRHRLSSLHVTFCEEAEAQGLRGQGFLVRRGLQYHWHNRDYADFEAFLAALRSPKRKMIRRERREVAEAGLTITCHHGQGLAEDALAAFYPFYLATVDKRWGQAYLTEAFFVRLARTMADRVVLFLARDRGGRTVAAALNLLGADTLYGRIWGALDEFRFLHFELCGPSRPVPRAPTRSCAATRR